MKLRSDTNSNSKKNLLTVESIQNAEKLLFKLLQQKYFKDESLEKSSKGSLVHLNPFIDDDVESRWTFEKITFRI